MPKGKKPTGKKTALTHTDTGFGVKPIDVAAKIRKIDRQFSEGDKQLAYRQIQQLCHQHPDQAELQQFMAELALEFGDFVRYGQACAQLIQLQPHNAHHFYGFASALVTGAQVLLARQMFLQAIALDPDNELADRARTTIASIETNFDELLLPADLPTDRDTAIDLLIKHEWAQVYLSWGEYEKCRETEQEVLQIKPNMLPALNNLSLIAFVQDDLIAAIDQSEQVLAIAPDNIHALANLVRYCVLADQVDRAQTFADRLKLSQAPAWDPWTKKLEAFSYLGDQAAIVETWEDLQQDPAALKALSAIELHYVAVAMARRGDIDQAQRLWQQALHLAPELSIAQANLDNLYQPAAEQHAAWAFSAEHWLSTTMRQQLTTELLLIVQAKQKNTKQNQNIKQVCQHYFDQHPEAMIWVEIMLDRGDPTICQVAIDLAKNADRPRLWDALHRFALGQQGADSLRHQTAIALVQAQRLEAENVRMWLMGEWQEIALLSYEFHDERPARHPRTVENLLKPALMLLRTGTVAGAVEAEALLQKALAIKSAPDLLNNLAVAYQLQHRDDAAKALAEQIIADYPTYIPARVVRAGYHLQNHETAAAEALLKPILKQTRIQIDDLATFSEGYLRLLIQQAQIQPARSWLELWSQVTPDHPRIPIWRQQLSLLKVPATIGKLGDRRRSGQRWK